MVDGYDLVPPKNEILKQRWCVRIEALMPEDSWVQLYLSLDVAVDWELCYETDKIELPVQRLYVGE